MKNTDHTFVHFLLIAVMIGAATPVYAGAIVEGTIFSNPSTIYDTGQQAGSPVSDVLTWSCPTSTCSPFGISGNGAAKVINGSLGVKSSFTVTGSPASTVGADSIANYTDMLTITGGTGSGVLELTYTANGTISEMGTNQSAASLFVLGPTGGFVQRNGGAITPSNGTGLILEGPHADTVIFYIPFTYGTALPIEPEMISNATFFSPPDSTPFTATVDFYNTATLNSARVFGGTPLALGTENTAAGINSTSGLSYGPNGISVIPEPGTWFLLASGMGVLAFLNRRRSLKNA